MPPNRGAESKETRMISGGMSESAMPGGRPARVQVAPERVRAWVLATATDAPQAAGALSAFFDQGGDDYVLVRADVVEGEANLIVPVDAASQAALDSVVAMIRDATGDSSPTVARVLSHNPDPPHRSYTFVTPGELDRDPVDEYSPPGRHPKSPGRNGWG